MKKTENKNLGKIQKDVFIKINLKNGKDNNSFPFRHF